MKRTWWTALFLSVFCLNAPAQVNSPVGVWEVKIGGDSKGYVVVDFGSDFSLSGYGITLYSFDVFTVTGTWNYDGTGGFVGSYTERVFGETHVGTFSGKAFWPALRLGPHDCGAAWHRLTQLRVAV